MKKLFLVLIGFLTFSVSSSLQAQDMPSADEIIDTYFENIGGKEVWRGLESMRITGKATQMGMEFPLTVSSMKPNLQKVEVSVQGMTIIDAYDGSSAWGVNPFMGSTEPQKKTEEESEMAAKQVFESELLDYKDKGHSVTVEGAEEVDGTDTYKLKLVKKDGDEMSFFFDQEDMVPILMRTTISAGEMKGQSVDTFVSDYREVEVGDKTIYVSFSMEQKMGGQTMMNMSAEKVEFNVEDLEADYFAYPADK
jgi:hypothetical protein